MGKHPALTAGPLGQRLWQLFGCNPWHFLEAKTPAPGDKPQWRTVKNYPLRVPPLPRKDPLEKGVWEELRQFPQVPATPAEPFLPYQEAHAAIQHKVQALQWSLEQVRQLLAEHFQGRDLIWELHEHELTTYLYRLQVAALTPKQVLGNKTVNSYQKHTLTAQLVSSKVWFRLIRHTLNPLSRPDQQSIFNDHERLANSSNNGTVPEVSLTVEESRRNWL